MSDGAIRWIGWVWSRECQRWLRACEAEDMGKCSRKTGEIADVMGVRDRDTCMTQGGYPQIRKETT
jgi:hypothetical protein